ncbi:hypothetical protein PALB_15480 [Pseudoalteromonas luteoviolacea B = ATCC 29581]|nr:hypothetical protein PALB_15480 [Pseudoalteromonas luteoviolacea B = ATCC 29581]
MLKINVFIGFILFFSRVTNDQSQTKFTYVSHSNTEPLLAFGSLRSCASVEVKY